MSIERLTMMKDYFESKGWSILNECHPKYDQGIYEPIEQKITWYLKHADPKLELLELEFLLFDGLGRSTKHLTDLSQCNAINRDQTLFFSKKSSQKWQHEYKEFIHKLSKM